MSSTITSLDLILSNSTIITASMTTNTDIFRAARVGLGALGIVVRVTIEVVPKFKLHRIAMPYPLDQLMLDLPHLNQQYDRLQCKVFLLFYIILRQRYSLVSFFFTSTFFSVLFFQKGTGHRTPTMLLYYYEYRLLVMQPLFHVGLVTLN